MDEIPPGGGCIDAAIAFRPLRIAILTVSDTRNEANDTSGKLLAERVVRDGHVLGDRKIVADDVAAIQMAVKSWAASRAMDVVISTGGTGLTGRDVTPEALRPLFDKTIEGFEPVWHMIGFQSVGLSTMQSRACAGIIGGMLFLHCLAPMAPARMAGIS
jgi:molybdenum cofactor biosynthesis protein B